MIAVSIARDQSGLEQAAFEMMEDALHDPERARVAQLAEVSANPEAVLASAPSARSLPEGYYARVGYLMELESILGLGVELRPDEIDLSELRGLSAIAAARRKFDRLHPPCARCGRRLENEWDKVCGECGKADLEQRSRTRGE